jgi:hypothetical protein
MLLNKQLNISLLAVILYIVHITAYRQMCWHTTDKYVATILRNLLPHSWQMCCHSARCHTPDKSANTLKTNPCAHSYQIHSATPVNSDHERWSILEGSKASPSSAASPSGRPPSLWQDQFKRWWNALIIC